MDGFLARKMGINSVFGSYLDPLADKVKLSWMRIVTNEVPCLIPSDPLVNVLIFTLNHASAGSD